MHLTISFQISLIIILIIATLALFTYVLYNGLSKLQEQVQQFCQINQSGLTPGRTIAISPSTETVCSKVHTFGISLLLDDQSPQVVIEFPHESWAAAFQLRCQYHVDPRWFPSARVPGEALPETQHYDRHLVAMPIPEDLSYMRFKRADDGLVFVYERSRERESVPPWHWSHASFLWTPVPSSSGTGTIKRQLRQVWSHQDFDDVFGRELSFNSRVQLLNNQARGELDDPARAVHVHNLRRPRGTGDWTTFQAKTAPRRETRHGRPSTPPPSPPPPSPSPRPRREQASSLASTRTRSNSRSRLRSKPREPRWLERLLRRRRRLGADNRREQVGPAEATYGYVPHISRRAYPRTLP